MTNDGIVSAWKQIGLMACWTLHSRGSILYQARELETLWIASVGADAGSLQRARASGARAAPSPEHAGTRPGAWKGNSVQGDFRRLRGTFSAGSPAPDAGNRDVAKPVSLGSSGTAWEAVRLFYLLGAGMWDWVVTKREREKKKESFISPPLREAVQIRIHFSCLCWLLFPKLPVAMNWVHSTQISEKLMGWDFSFSMLFDWTMQKHALLQYKYAFRYRWDTKSWQLCRTDRSHLCVWSSHGGSNGELPVNGASQRQQSGTLQLLPKHHLLVWQDFSVTWALIFTWSSNFHLKKCFH